MIFPKEKPPFRDFWLWHQILYLIVPRGQIADSIGNFTGDGHKIWPWGFGIEAYRLLHLKTELTDIYTLSMALEIARPPNMWTHSVADAEKIEVGEICTVKQSDRFVNVLCHTRTHPKRVAPTVFWDIV